MPLFDLGFGPDQPSPQEIEQAPLKASIVKGVAAGIEQAARSKADQLIAEPMKAADTIVGDAIEPANDAIGSISTLAEAIGEHARQIALNGIQAPLGQGLTLGYSSKGTPLLAAQGAAKRRRGRKRSTVTDGRAVDTVEAEQLNALPQPLPGVPVDIGPIATGPGVPPCPPGTAQHGDECWTGEPGPLPPPEPPPYPLPGPVPIGKGPPPVNCPPGEVAIGEQCYPIGIPPLPPPKLPPPNPPGGIPPPAPPPCPPANITVNCPPLPPPAIWIIPPPCPQCGKTPPPVVAPPPILPPIIGPGQPIIIPPPPINIDVPPCPSCHCPQQSVTVDMPPVDVTVNVDAGGGTTPTTAAGGAPKKKPPPEILPPLGECPTCSIPYLSLHYPDFVLAERAAQKTDYDILIDAITLKLCCTEELPKMPGCSMPYLQRMVPDFVRAAKDQGLSDDRLLQQAVNIGLCADEPVSTGLGEGNVGLIAPGSAEEIDAEFDPPKSGEAPALAGQTPVFSEATDFCWQAFVLPAPATPAGDAPEGADCLTGWQRVIYTFMTALDATIKDNCACGDGSFFQDVGVALNQMYNKNSWYTRAIYYVGQSLLWLAREGTCNTLQVGNWFNALSGCTQSGASALVVGSVLTGIWERWIGKLPAQFTDGLNAAMGFACPAGTPSAAEANGLLATNFIDEKLWSCLVRADGRKPDFQEPIVASLRRRPTDEDVLLLGRLGEMGQDKQNEFYRHNGWTNDESLNYWKLARQWVPSPGDAVEWMLKDTQDQQIQETFLLSAEFNQKYGGAVQAAFDANGVSKANAENMWRAHWRNVDPTLLYHMHKRLRPGWTALLNDGEVYSYIEAICPRKGPQVTPDILAARPISNGFPIPTYCDELYLVPPPLPLAFTPPAPAIGPNLPGPATGRAYLESIVVTGYHASEALGQDDYPPFWRPRMLALSYNVLTRVDARRAYEIGLFTDAKLVSVYMDQGYKQSDAEALTAFAHQQLVLKFVRSPTAKTWIQFPYNVGLLAEMLEADGMRPDLFDEVREILTLKRSVYKVIAQLREAKKQVVGGRVDKQAAVKKVVGILKGG